MREIMYKKDIWKELASLILAVVIFFPLLASPRLSLAQAINDNASSSKLEEVDVDVPSVSDSLGSQNVNQAGPVNPEQTTDSSGDVPINSDDLTATPTPDSLDETNHNIVDESTADTTTSGEEALESADNNSNDTQSSIVIDESNLAIAPTPEELDKDLEGADLDVSDQDGFAPGNPVGQGPTVAQIFLVADGAKTEFSNLQAALDAVEEGQTIQLLANITLETELEATKSAGYTLDLDGYTVSGNNKVRILNIKSGNLTIKNGTFKEGYTAYSGGAIYMDSNSSLQLVGMTFKDNIAIEKGGALYLTNQQKDKRIIEKCTFQGNMSQEGAAMYLSGERMEVHECTLLPTNYSNFTNPSTGEKIVVKSAIYNEAAVKYKDCNFSNQRALLRPLEARGHVTTEGCNIRNNFSSCTNDDSSNIVVGALYVPVSGVWVYIDDQSVITKNHASGGSNRSGGIYISSGSEIFLQGGASVYSNTAEGFASGNDFVVKSHSFCFLNPPANMTDPMTGYDFTDYKWVLKYSLGRVDTTVKKVMLLYEDQDVSIVALRYSNEPVALTNGNLYYSLAEAVQEAKVDGIVKIVIGDGSGTLLPIFQETVVNIDRNLTLDLNGRIFESDISDALVISNSAECAIVDSSQSGNSGVVGRVKIEDGSKLLLDSSCKITDIVNDGSLVISGRHDSLNVRLGAGKYINIDDVDNDFSLNSLTISLDDAVIEKMRKMEQDSPVKLIEVPLGKEYILVDLYNNIKFTVNMPWSYEIKDNVIGLYPTVDTTNNKAIHLSGLGADNNDGRSLRSPVQTFEMAKEKLEDEPGIIYITDTVNISGAEKWSLKAGQKVVRHPSNRGDLITVKGGGKLTLEHITIDGLSEQFIDNAGCLIKVEEGGKLELKAGSTLQNNNRLSASGYSTGGGIDNRGELIMFSGSMIQNCIANLGGGVYTCKIEPKKLYKQNNDCADNSCGVFTMKDGAVITKCHARTKASDVSSSSGGGVFIANGGLLNLAGGEISHNTAYANGGGVAVGCVDADYVRFGQPKLNMSGGIIKSNESGVANIPLLGAGGGIFIQENGEATISGGHITENKAYRGFYGGGGIYVNGGNLDKYNLPDGVLRITNVMITGNLSKRNGGGIAGCPTSTINIYQTNGAAIFNNDVEIPTISEIHSEMRRGNEIYTHSGNDGAWKGNADVDISSYMLDGTSFEWQDGRYGKEGPIDQALLKSKGESLGLNSKRNGSDFDIAAAGVRTFITKNYTTGRGGGIGSNGIVIIGEPSITDDYDLSYPEKETEVTLEVSGAPVFFNARTGNVASPQPSVVKFELINAIPGASIDASTGVVTYIPPLGTAAGTIVIIKVRATYADDSIDLGEFIVHVKAAPGPVEPTPAPVDPSTSPIDPPGPAPVDPSARPTPTTKEKLAWVLGISQEGADRGYSRYDYILGSHKNLHFAVNADNQDALLAEFSLVDVWGREFGFSPQSDILLLANGRIELAASFLETLKPGSYILSVTYREGEKVLAGTIRVVFKVVDGDSAEHISQDVSHSLPATGGTSLLKSLIVSSSLIALGLYFAKKQKS